MFRSLWKSKAQLFQTVLFTDGPQSSVSVLSTSSPALEDRSLLVDSIQPKQAYGHPSRDRVSPKARDVQREDWARTGVKRGSLLDHSKVRIP